MEDGVGQEDLEGQDTHHLVVQVLLQGKEVLQSFYHTEIALL